VLVTAIDIQWTVILLGTAVALVAARLAQTDRAERRRLDGPSTGASEVPALTE
jgi:hypothetical protein